MKEIIIKEEVWKDIPGTSGAYQASNFGNIRSTDRIVEQRTKWGGISKSHLKGKLLRQHPHPSGYVTVTISKAGKCTSVLVHRLVAMTFINNPEKYSTVNHKDENKRNNHVDNLEWMPLKENVLYGTGHQRGQSQKNLDWFHAHSGGKNPNAKKVRQYSKDGNFIKEWNCCSEASEALGINLTSICSTARGKSKSAGGFIWKY